MADTDIILTVGLDTRDADKTAEQLQKEVQNIFNSRGGRQSAALTSLEKQMKQTYQKATDLREKLSSLGSAKVPTAEYEKLEKELNSLESSASKLSRKMREFEEKGGDTTSEKYQRWEREIERIGVRASETVEKIEKMKEAGTDTVSGTETAKYKQTQAELDGVNDRLKQQIIRHREIEAGGVKAFSKVGAVVGTLKSGLAKVVSAAKKLFSTLKRDSSGANTSLKKSLTTILKYGLGIRSLYALFNKLRSAIKEGFSNLYKSSDSFRKSVDDLKGSLTTLKNAFASAFQPIVSMAIPYIKSLIEWVTQLMDQIARFTAAAVGQKYYMKAIKQTGQAAEKASRQLAGFDELNVLSAGGGAGGGGMFEEVPIDEEKIDLLEKLREIVAKMEGLGNKFGTAIRDALNSIPWDKIKEVVNLVAEGIGNFINGLVRAEGLGDSIGRNIAELGNTLIGFQQTLLDTIDFGAIGKLIGETLQSWVDNFDWVGYGKLWATKINSVFETLKGIVDNFEGLSLGISFGDSFNTFMQDLDWDTINSAIAGLAEDIVGILNGFLQTTDWSLVGETLSQGVSQLLDFAIDFISNFDAEALGEAIISFISGIDWERLAHELLLLLYSLIEKAIELLFGMAAQLASNIADLFDYLGVEGVAGFFRGIEENLKASVEFLREFFTNYVVNPIKDFFGIHSPSTLFADFGTMLIQGLINGITSKFTALGEILRSLKEKFLEKFTEVKVGVVNIIEKLWEAVKAPINSIIGGFEFLVNCVISALNKMITACNNLQFDIPDWIPSIGGESFGLNIPTLNEISIPRLAQGAVIPPNKSFLAMLGDQNSGTNVEAPLATIQEAMMNALQATGFGGEQTINVYLGTKLIYSEVKKLEKRDVVMGG